MHNLRAEDNKRDIIENNKYLIHQWNNTFGKGVLQTYTEKENPLPNLIDKMVINYNTGGLFNIKHV